ncbi:hypothetical protein FPOAC2_11802 [Fusarium poae]|jgi:hypothetical protein|uniref:hypothetical protein n=1 Tax=Fusarium poae TaxID=36050 RepID=UPI001CE88BA3|nr:hypothetical protein FPOAC1_011498 [Fusarium poae]KAG8666686.1 hypothetical protein FPOAC1_011498 [Fusarium poae]
MANYALTDTMYTIHFHQIAFRLGNLREIVNQMYHDFPVLDRAQCEKGLVQFPFNLPSRDFMRSVDEDLSELSDELETFPHEFSQASHRLLRDALSRRLESVESAFQDIHTKVLKLDPVRLDESLAELEEAEDCFNTALDSLLFSEED